jgi:hypothetical protein
VDLRDAVEEAVRRWDALERSHSEPPVIDFDCAPPGEKPKPRPFENRFAALDQCSAPTLTRTSPTSTP